MYLFTFLIPDWIVIVVVILFILYKWVVAKHDHFIKLQVDHDTPYPFFGTFKDLYLRTDNYCGILIKQYEKYKHRSFFGIFDNRRPILVVTDPTLIRQITVSDFEHFVNHGEMFNSTTIMGLTVDMLKDDKWKNVRTALAPVYSPGNLRFMFYLVEECSALAIQNLKAETQNSPMQDVNIFEFFGRFFIDILASTTCGMKPNSLSSKNNIFFKKIMGTLDITPTLYAVHFLHGNFPFLMKLLRIRIISNDFISYFNSLIKEIIEYRRMNNIKHFDIIQMLMKEKEKVGSSQTEGTNQNEENNLDSLTNDEIVTQCLVMLLDGLVKSSVIACSAVVELAANPAIQRKLQREIDKVSELVDGNIISYDVLKAMDYLDMVMFETLRKWSTEHVIDRVCTKPYTLYDKTSGHSVKLNPGETVCIPTVALNRDPNYFPEPEKFNPERFNENNRGFIRPYSFLPFGVGPRNCIGGKFALMQIKAALVSLLSEYSVERVSEAKTEVLAENRGFFMSPRNEPIVRLRHREMKEVIT